MNWEAFALSDLGRRRARNEDSHLFRPEKRLFAVADGMGGHAAGDVASRTAIDVVDACFQEPPTTTDPEAVGRFLVSVAEAANREICDRSAAEADKRGMGTTLTMAVPLDGTCVIAHIGDSRVYRLRGRELVQLTTDHTWVQHQVAVGALTPVEARVHPYSSVLTRVLGLPDVGVADVITADARPGDVFLLCSDGLTSMVEDADIEAILSRDKPLDQLAHDLVQAANLRGGFDNVTVILMRPSRA